MNAPSSSSATARDLTALQAELTAALSQIVSDDALLWEREDTTPYECDGLAAYRQVPLAVVLPDTEAQVVEILRVCHRMGVPVVPRGAERACRAARCRPQVGWSSRWPSSSAS